MTTPIASSPREDDPEREELRSALAHARDLLASAAEERAAERASLRAEISRLTRRVRALQVLQPYVAPFASGCPLEELLRDNKARQEMIAQLTREVRRPSAPAEPRPRKRGRRRQ